MIGFFWITIGISVLSLLTPSVQNRQTPNVIIDPMDDVTPMETSPLSAEINQEATQANSRTSNRINHGSGKPDLAASKRFADERQLIVQSRTQPNNQPQPSASTEDDQVSESCAYTFIVPQQAVQTPVCSGSKQGYLTNLHEDVLATKLQVEEMRNAINEEKQQLSNSNTISNMQKKISYLERDSTNMDQRVSQLYMQLLHEIINKRDNSIEVQNLEKKLLNQTIHYYQLLENHERLQRDHNALEVQVNDQSNELKNLRQHFEELRSQIEDCKRTGEPTTKSTTTVETTTTIQPPACKNENEQTLLPPPKTNFPPGPFRDCLEVQKAGYIRSGTFNLKLPTYENKIRVWCDLEQDPGGWIVIQRRSGRRLKFSKNMEAYKRGFGRPHSDHWLGLENLNQLTNQTGVNYKLQVVLEDWDGRKKFAEYRSFRVGDQTTGYRLKITHYSGNAGDSLTWHNNMAFTTSDVDNDESEANCAVTHRGGWWYRNCARSNLNGIYYRGGHYMSRNQDGVYWSSWRDTIYSLKNVVMKIKPLE